MKRRPLALDTRSHVHLSTLSKALGVGWSCVVRLAVDYLGQRFEAATPEQREQLRAAAHRDYEARNA